MPQKDKLHELFRRLLEEAGWRITHDPLTIPYGVTKTFIDLGAEPALAAELDGEKIAVEIKSFVGVSGLTDLEKAVGQFVIYKAVLGLHDPGRTLYLAVPGEAFESFLDNEEGRAIRSVCGLKLIVFDTKAEVIEQWIG